MTQKLLCKNKKTVVPRLTRCIMRCEKNINVYVTTHVHTCFSTLVIFIFFFDLKVILVLNGRSMWEIVILSKREDRATTLQSNSIPDTSSFPILTWLHVLEEVRFTVNPLLKLPKKTNFRTKNPRMRIPRVMNFFHHRLHHLRRRKNPNPHQVQHPKNCHHHHHTHPLR